MSILVKQDIIPREPTGLVDGEHKILKCSGCNESLIDVWMVKPDDSLEDSFRAECALCGDHSFVATFRGKVAVGSVENGRVMMCDFTKKVIDGKNVNIVHTVSLSEPA